MCHKILIIINHISFFFFLERVRIMGFNMCKKRKFYKICKDSVIKKNVIL